MGGRPSVLDAGVDVYTGEEGDIFECVGHLDEGHSTMVVVFPGNPGVVKLYTHFVESLQLKLPGSTPVIAVGHLGHSAGRLWPGQRFTLEDQIQHKVRFMHWLKTRLPDTRFVLVGHSIGCYIALQTMKRCGDEIPFGPCVSVFPTLYQIGNQAGMLRFVVRPLVRHLTGWSVCGVLGCLPRSWRRRIAAKAWKQTFQAPGEEKEDEEGEEAMVDAGGESEQNEAEIALLSRHKEGYSATLDHVVDLLHVDFVLNVALMAHTEFQQVVAPDEDLMEEMHRRMICVYTSPDAWVPDEHADEMEGRRDTYQDGWPIVFRVPEESHIPHPFVMNHSMDTARIVAGLLLRHDPGLQPDQ